MSCRLSCMTCLEACLVSSAKMQRSLSAICPRPSRHSIDADFRADRNSIKFRPNSSGCCECASLGTYLDGPICPACCAEARRALSAAFGAQHERRLKPIRIGPVRLAKPGLRPIYPPLPMAML